MELEKVNNAVVKACVSRFGPEAIVVIYLFGSRAYGGAKESSDYDYMIVFNDKNHREINSKGNWVEDEVSALRKLVKAQIGIDKIDILQSSASRFDTNFWVAKQEISAQNLGNVKRLTFEHLTRNPQLSFILPVAHHGIQIYG